MLRTLDPHSIFFDPDQNEQLKQMENSESKGFRDHRFHLARTCYRPAGDGGNVRRPKRGWSRAMKLWR